MISGYRVAIGAGVREGSREGEGREGGREREGRNSNKVLIQAHASTRDETRDRPRQDPLGLSTEEESVQGREQQEQRTLLQSRLPGYEHR
jgi:hypothetical protein